MFDQSSIGAVATPSLTDLHREAALDVSRLRVLPRASKHLVMDRISGRWVLLEPQLEPLLQLLAQNPQSIPAGLRNSVEELRGSLIKEGLGQPGSEREFSALNTLILKLTNACNLACKYCYDYEQQEHATTLALDHMRNAIVQALELASDTLWVILHGGEPTLMWRQIEELVTFGEQVAKQAGKDIRFTGQSNFTRLNDRIVEFSLDHDISWGISLDGDAGLNDRLRVDHQGKGSYHHFYTAYEKYPDFVKQSSVMSTITALNESKLLAIARHFRDLGMAAWDWSLFQPIGRGRSQQLVYQPRQQTLLAAWNKLFDAVLSGEFDGFPVLPVRKYLDNFIYGPAGNMCMRPQCGAARDLLSISADGTIEACDCIDPTGPLSGLGHLDRTSLRESREAPVAKAIRGRDMARHPHCSDCIWFGICGGTCVAHAGNLDGVWSESCTMALTAFDRISQALVDNRSIQRYLNSLN